ncbi:MAG: glucose 1-dehydrogenase [Nevskia sp.]|nr:glucose 1-dehydrogenase [Nevskia sp.]
MGMLEGKVAVITGGTSGIGARCAERFVEAGARVVIAGRREAEGQAVARRLGAAARYFRADVESEPQVRDLVGFALDRFGRLDCLVNNAGHVGPMAGIAELDAADFDHMLRVHLRGAALGMKHAAPAMQRQRSGSIVNMASLGGLRGGWTPHAYSAAKAGLVHLSRCVAVELGEHGVRVNCISPGPVVTGIFGKGAGLAPSRADQAVAGLAEAFAALQPIPRAGRVDDIANAAVFLASDAASFVNGQNLVVDGGSEAAGRPWSSTLAQVRAMADQFMAGS